MVARKLKVYYLHNINGRDCGMIAAFNKASVSRALRIPQSEITKAGRYSPEGQALALGQPGRLFTQPIHTHDPSVWNRSLRECVDIGGAP